MAGAAERTISIERTTDWWAGRFRAMASPCEVLIEACDEAGAQELTQRAADEAWRIEDKFSRYLDGNVVHTINTSEGEPVAVDEETAKLLDFAGLCHRLSGGAFDITSGVLRKAWTFDGGDRLPDTATVEAALADVGWNRVRWDGDAICLEPGMQIDLGGLGKEYAVDSAASSLALHGARHALINFGGDLAAIGPREDTTPWRVGLDTALPNDGDDQPLVLLSKGGVATSGDTQRFILHEGRRYGHILDPRTGWPVENSPHTITVLAANCVQAGMLATLAMLRGEDAETFLDHQKVEYWVTR